ncbi:MAG: IS200/IS605 family transposase [Armatimonadetes bacterium]|nr:IS200/IS605 family transposase [Armatimonadota bacterium]
MSRRHDTIYLHFVWTTWNRQPLITPDLEAQLYYIIRQECIKQRALVLALNGMDDHVHLLVRLPAALAPSAFIKQVKGASSRWVSQRSGEVLKWRGGYAVFSVSYSDVRRVVEYIRNQKQHHTDGTVIGAWEDVMEHETESKESDG